MIKWTVLGIIITVGVIIVGTLLKRIPPTFLKILLFIIAIIITAVLINMGIRYIMNKERWIHR